MHDGASGNSWYLGLPLCSKQASKIAVSPLFNASLVASCIKVMPGIGVFFSSEFGLAPQDNRILMMGNASLIPFCGNEEGGLTDESLLCLIAQ